MGFVYELLRAGTTSSNSDTGAEVARKINDNFKNASDKVSEIEQTLSEKAITKVKVGDQDVGIEGGELEIPIAGSNQCGVIQSSEEENKIRVDKDGEAEVVSLNVNKLVQNEGDYLIFDGNIE